MIYQHPQETWDEKKCEKKAKHVAQDGLGTPYPWPGYIGSHYGTHHYNGGCDRDGEWYEGEHWSLPIIAPGYEITKTITWGYRIIKTK